MALGIRRKLVGAVGLALFALSVTPVSALPATASTIPYAYVVNSGSRTVSVVNTSTNTVVKAVKVSSYPADIAITPKGTYGYVTGEVVSGTVSSGIVSVIKLSTDTVVKTVKVGSYPSGVAIT